MGAHACQPSHTPPYPEPAATGPRAPSCALLEDMPRLPRRSTLITLVLAVAVSLFVAGSVGGSSQAAQKAGLGIRMDHIPAPDQVIHYPTNAGTVFKWGVPKWTDEFEVNPLRKDWVQSRQGKVKTQSGMLTVIGTGKQTKITASPTSVKARYGRWEARVRIRETNHNGDRYRAYWELVPTGDFKCGAKSIVLASYKSQDKQGHRRGARTSGGPVQLQARSSRCTRAGSTPTPSRSPRSTSRGSWTPR